MACVVGVVIQFFFADVAKNAIRAASVLNSESKAPQKMLEPKLSTSNQHLYTSASNTSYSQMTHMQYNVVTSENICRIVMNYIVERSSDDEVLFALIRGSTDVQNSVYVQEMNTLLRAYNRCYPSHNVHMPSLANAPSCQFPMLEIQKTCKNEQCKQTRDLSCSRKNLLSMHTACNNATSSLRSVWLLCMSCLVA